MQPALLYLLSYLLSMNISSVSGGKERRAKRGAFWLGHPGTSFFQLSALHPPNQSEHQIAIVQLAPLWLIDWLIDWLSDGTVCSKLVMMSPWGWWATEEPVHLTGCTLTVTPSHDDSTINVKGPDIYIPPLTGKPWPYSCCCIIARDEDS